jgi:hypothetical protein
MLARLAAAPTFSLRFDTPISWRGLIKQVDHAFLMATEPVVGKHRHSARALITTWRGLTIVEEK